MLAEHIAKYMLAYDGIAEPDYDNTHANRVKFLKQNDLLPREIDNTFRVLRLTRNDATHNGMESEEQALSNLKLSFELCVWFMQTYGDYNFIPNEYIVSVRQSISIEELEKSNKDLEENNKALLQQLIDIQKNGKSSNDRRSIAYKNAANIKLSGSNRLSNR
jgi:type I restriction enzyme R subunit